MDHSLIALNVYQFLAAFQTTCNDKQIFDDILWSLKSPRFTSVSAIRQRWTPLFAQQPQFFNDFNQLFFFAEQSLHDDKILQNVAEHYPLIYRVSCFLESDLELELFVRSLCLDSITPVKPKEIRETIFQFLNQLSPDVREIVMHIIIEDEHGYFGKEDCLESEFLDLDRLQRIIGDEDLFEQVMATIQINTFLSLPWTQTIQDIYEMIRHKDIWDQLAPVLQQVQTVDQTEYTSYEDYVQKNFLDDGGQQYLDNEINRSQVEHMFQNLKM